MNSLKNKVAIVTGAASGIGAATADLLAKEGAQVIVADINLRGAQERVEAIQAAGGSAAAVAMNLGDSASIAAMFDFTIKTYGGLDVLHNNAADTRLSSTRDAPLEHLDLEVWDEIFRINLRGTVLATKLAIPLLRQRGGGSIIMTSSGASLSGDLGTTAYGSAKAALNMVTKYVATQHGKENIRCNAICPGLILTPATATNFADPSVINTLLAHHLTTRVGKPEDIAAMVRFLASDESAFITGQLLQVDGGMLAHMPYVADFQRQGSHPTSPES